MAITQSGSVTMLNGEATSMTRYRRVKIDGSNPTKVLYADAADGDSWIGVTEPMESGDVAPGDPVAIRLRAENQVLKIECSAACLAGASVYPENDGKVSDDAGTVVVGTCLITGSGAAAIASVIPNAGSGSAPDEEAIANADGTTGAGIGVLLTVTATATGNTTIPKPARKLKIVNAWFRQNGTTASDINLVNAGNTATRASVSSGTTANAFKQLEVTNAQETVLSTSTLTVNLSTTEATGIEVYVHAIPVA